MLPGLRAGDRGFALLIVLWAVALLALLFTQLASSGRSEARIAVNLRNQLRQETNAASAIQIAAFHLLDHADTRWRADGGAHTVALHGGTVQLHISDEADKVNLNTASADLLRELLAGVGTDLTTPDRLAQAIVDWRSKDAARPLELKLQLYRAAGLTYGPPEASFRGIEELTLVAGMTPHSMDQLRPHLTIHSSYGPGRATPDSIVRAALDRVRQSAGELPLEFDGNGVEVVCVAAAARGADGAAAALSAILRLDAGSQTRPFAMLAWAETEAGACGGGGR